MLINPSSFELGLMIGAKRAFVSVTPPNYFQPYSFNKSVNFVRSDMSETFFVHHRTFLDDMTDIWSNCRLWPDQPVQYILL